jgi:hypothetical protein
MNFMIFTASVWNILDTPSYTPRLKKRLFLTTRKFMSFHGVVTEFDCTWIFRGVSDFSFIYTAISRETPAGIPRSLCTEREPRAPNHTHARAHQASHEESLLRH